MMRKALSLVLVAAIAAALLVSCSRQAKPAGAKETIVIGGWPAGDTAFEAIIGLFNQEYPNIEVKLGNFMPSGDYHRELQASIAAGRGAPDVAMIEEAHVGRYKDDAGFENLLGAPYNAGGMKKDFVEYKWNNAVSLDGKQMIGLVWDIGPVTLFYNRAILDSVGLPSDPDSVTRLLGTWNGVLEVAEKVSIKDRRWFTPNAADVFGWNFLNRDFYDSRLNFVFDRPGARDGLQAAMTIRKNGWDAQTGLWDNETMTYLNADQVFCVSAGCWYGGFLKADWLAPNGAGKWGVCRLPAGIADSNQGGSYLAIPSQSANKEAAWKFIQFALATKQGQNGMFAAVDYFPGYKPAWDDPMYNEADPYFAGQKTRALWAEIAGRIKPSTPTSMDATTEWELIQAVNDGMNEGKSADEIVRYTMGRIEEATKLEKEQYIEILKKAGKW